MHAESEIVFLLAAATNAKATGTWQNTAALTIKSAHTAQKASITRVCDVNPHYKADVCKSSRRTLNTLTNPHKFKLLGY